MKNRWCMSVVFLFIAVFALWQLSYAVAPAQPDPVGRVIWVKGSFKAVMENKEVRTLKKKSVIYLKDTLQTGAASQAQIAFTDNTLMTFREGTKFYIDEYKYQPDAKEGSVGKYIMTLVEGGFRTITGLIAQSNPNDYKVNTPVATIGVRGTDYAVYFGKGGLYVGYYKGSPCVSNRGGQICLNPSNKFANVKNTYVAPVPVTQQPAVFKQKLEVIPTKITPFSAVESATSVRSVRDTGPKIEGSGAATQDFIKPKTGTTSSFCITN